MFETITEDIPKRKRGRPRKEVKTPRTQGWECPKCGKVLAPHVRECTHNVKQPVLTDTIYSRNF